MKKINSPSRNYRVRYFNGQTTVCFGKFTWVLIKEQWYEIRKNWQNLSFPVLNKEETVSKILKKIDEIKD